MTYDANCFHLEKNSVEVMLEGSMNLEIYKGSLSSSWCGMPPRLRENEIQQFVMYLSGVTKCQPEFLLEFDF